MRLKPAIAELAQFASQNTRTSEFVAVFGAIADDILPARTISAIASEVDIVEAGAKIDTLVNLTAAQAVSSCLHRFYRYEGVQEQVFDRMTEGYLGGLSWAATQLGVAA